MEQDLDALAELRRRGDVEAWTEAFTTALRRTPVEHGALLFDLFSLPSHLLDPGQARRIEAALLSRLEPTIASVPLRDSAAQWREHWQSRPTVAPTIGRVTDWLMVSGYEAERGAALGRIDPPQERFGPTERFQTPLGVRSVRAVRVTPTRSFLFPQDWTFPSRKRCGHFAAAFSVEKSAQLSLRGGDERRVWVNGKAVLELRGLENGLGGSLTFGPRLEPGTHQIEIRSCPRFGSGGFALYVHDDTGRLIPLRSEAFESRTTPLPSDFPRFEAGATAAQRVAKLRSPRLRHLLGAVHLANLGQRPDALAALGPTAESPLPERWLAMGMARASRRKETHMAMVESLGDDRYGKAQRAEALSSLSQGDRAAQLMLPSLGKLESMNRFEQWVTLRLASDKAPAGAMLRLWRAIAAKDPTWTKAQRQLAKWLKTARRHDEAERLLESLVNAGLGGTPALDGQRERAAGQRDHDAALSISQRILNFDPLDTGEQLARVDLLSRAGRLAESTAALDALLAQNPYHVGGLWRRAAEQRLAGGEQAASATIQALKAVAPEHRQVLRSERFAALQRPNQEFKSPFWQRPSAEQIEALIAKREQFRPDTAVGQVLLIDDHLDMIQADGSRRQVVTLVRWLLDRRSAQQYLKINLGGLRNRQIHQAYMVRANGERVDPVSMRRGEIRFREMGAGAVLVLQYESTQKRSSILTGLVSGTFWFEGTDNVAVDSRYTLAVARPDLEPRFTIVGPEPQRRQREHDGVRVWSFARSNVPPAAIERSVHAPWRYRSQVRFSTMPDWGPYVAWVRDLFRQASKVTERVAAKAAELTRGRARAQDKIDAIYAFAVEKIQYEQDYARVIEGWEPHLPDQVLERRYGDCKDKTMLIVTMLESVGIEAHPALIRTWRLGDLDKSLPSSQFNHAVVWLPAQEGIKSGRFLDATAEYLDHDNLRLDIQATEALIIEPKRWSFRTVPARDASEERMDAQLTYLGEDRWRAEMTYRGHAAGMIRRVGEGQKRQFLLESLGARMFWPGTTLESGKLDDAGKRLRIVLELKAPAGTVSSSGKLQLPEIMTRPFGSWFEKPERKLDLRIANTRSLNLLIEVPNHRIKAGEPLKMSEHGMGGALTCGGSSCRFINVIEPLVLEPKAYAKTSAAQRRFSAAIKGREIILKAR